MEEQKLNNGIKEFLPLVIIAISTFVVNIIIVTHNLLVVLCLELLLFWYVKNSTDTNTNITVDSLELIIVIVAIITMLLSQEILALIFLVTALVLMTIKLLAIIIIGTMGSYFLFYAKI